MIRLLAVILILLSGTCKTCDKENLLHRLQVKKKIRFQIPVFEIEGISREERIRLSEEFANSWLIHTGYEAIVLDQRFKSELLRSTRQIPSTNFSIQSQSAYNIFRVRVVDMETGEILSFGKIPFTSKEDLSHKFAFLIQEQLLCNN
jgi:hypothetical protein